MAYYDDFLDGTTMESASSGNVAAATASCSFAADPGIMNFLSGFNLTGSGATVGNVVSLTVTGLLGGTMTYTVAVPTGATIGVPALIVQFPEAIMASAANTAITVSVPSFGTGNTHAAVSMYGYRRKVVTTT